MCLCVCVGGGRGEEGGGREIERKRKGNRETASVRVYACVKETEEETEEETQEETEEETGEEKGPGRQHEERSDRWMPHSLNTMRVLSPGSCLEV